MSIIAKGAAAELREERESAKGIKKRFLYEMETNDLQAEGKVIHVTGK